MKKIYQIKVKQKYLIRKITINKIKNNKKQNKSNKKYNKYNKI